MINIIIKRSPNQLWHCNTMRLAGCKEHCTEYKFGVGWQACKRHKELCEPFEIIQNLYK